MRRVALAAGLLVLAVAAGIVAPAQGHEAAPSCEGDITVEEVRGHAGQECVFHFTGLPVVLEGEFFTDNADLKSDIHVGLIAELADGTRQTLPVECYDLGRAGDPMAHCRTEWDPTSAGPASAAVPMLQDVVALICDAHSHARESLYYGRYFGESAGGWFRCSSS